MIDPITYDDEVLREHLRIACKAAGGQTAWARAHGLSISQVNGACCGERAVGPRIAAKLGYEQITVYIKRGVSPDLRSRRGLAPACEFGEYMKGQVS